MRTVSWRWPSTAGVCSVIVLIRRCDELQKCIRVCRECVLIVYWWMCVFSSVCGKRQQKLLYSIKYIQIQLNNRPFLVFISDDADADVQCMRVSVCRTVAHGVSMANGRHTIDWIIFMCLFFSTLHSISLTANGEMHKTTAKYLLCAVRFFLRVLFLCFAKNIFI